MQGEIWTYVATKPNNTKEAKVRPVLVIGDDSNNQLQYVDIHYVIISSSAECGIYDVLLDKKLAKELGLGVGISSGANFIGAVLTQDKLEGNMVTVFADDNKKYLSTDLGKKMIENTNFMSNQIELLNYEIV